MIGIDTFSWGKLIRLKNDNGWNKVITELIPEIDWFITVEGRKEFEHFFPTELGLLDHCTVLPILNEILDEFLDKGFDKNDASLLEYNTLRKYRIITEDRPMLLEGVTGKQDIIMLVDFFSELTGKDNYFTSRELYHLVQLFKKWRNIDEKKENAIETLRKKRF